MEFLIIIFILLALIFVTAIIFKLFFKFDEFEEKFKRAHRENFINRFHCDGFDLSHHND